MDRTVVKLDSLADAGPTVTVDVAAQCLGIGRSLAYQLLKRGEFPVRVLKVGNRNRIPTADLRTLLGIPHPAA